MDRLEQAKPSPWKGSEQFLSSEASFPIPLPIYLVTLPRQRGIQGKCLPLTASVPFFFFNVSPCVAGAWPWQWQQRWYFFQDERLSLKQFLRGSRTVLVFHCLLCTLWLCFWDFSKSLAKWTTQLFICRFLVRVSYLEIYNEEVRDLLGKDQTQRLEVSLPFWMWCLFWIRVMFSFKDQGSSCREVGGWAPQQSSVLCNAIAGCHCWLFESLPLGQLHKLAVPPEAVLYLQFYPRGPS